MAFDFVWNGTGDAINGDVDKAKNWDGISIVNATYRWVLSGSGTNEYFVELAGGGDPGISEQPDFVQELDPVGGQTYTDMPEGTLGALTPGDFDYGDNDTLGFSTVYVRLTNTGTPDPDDNNVDHVQFLDVPYASQNWDAGNGSQEMSTNLQALTALTFVDVSIAQDFTGAIALLNEPLRFKVSGVLTIGYLKTDGTTPTGSGRLHMDIQDSNCTVKIERSSVSPTDSGFNPIRLLVRNSSTKIYQRGGSASYGVNPGDIFTASLLSVSGDIEAAFARVGYPGGQANIAITDTDAWANGEIVAYDGPSGTLNIFEGIYRLLGQGVFGTANVRETGLFELSSTGDHSSATVNIHDATLDTFGLDDQPITIGTVDLKEAGAIFRESKSIIVTTLTRSYTGKREVSVS